LACSYGEPGCVNLASQKGARWRHQRGHGRCKHGEAHREEGEFELRIANVSPIRELALSCSASSGGNGALHLGFPPVSHSASAELKQRGEKEGADGWPVCQRLSGSCLSFDASRASRAARPAQRECPLGLLGQAIAQAGGGNAGQRRGLGRLAIAS
jgi:hypothetical protein